MKLETRTRRPCLHYEIEEAGRINLGILLGRQFTQRGKKRDAQTSHKKKTSAEKKKTPIAKKKTTAAKKKSAAAKKKTDAAKKKTAAAKKKTDAAKKKTTAAKKKTTAAKKKTSEATTATDKKFRAASAFPHLIEQGLTDTHTQGNRNHTGPPQPVVVAAAVPFTIMPQHMEVLSITKTQPHSAIHPTTSEKAPTAVHVRTIAGKTYECPVLLETDTVWSLKKKLRDLADIPVEQQRLLFSGHQMNDTEILGSLGISSISTIFLLLKLKSG